MKLRSKNILGLPIFAIAQGEKLGQVKDYVFHPEKKEIIALVISTSKRFGEEKILPLSNIKSFGKEAITVENSTKLEKKGANPEIATYMKKMTNIIGVKVITIDGCFLGKATEFFIDSSSGKVTSLSLGSSLVDYLLKGKNYLPAEVIDVFGNDVILAQANARPTLEKARQIKEKEILEADKTQKVAHTNTLWNKSRDKIKEKTKVYISKIPSSAVFSDILAEKESPSVGVEKTHKTKGAISYKDNI